jgi:uncharacterized RDD family membrane protein YckC
LAAALALADKPAPPNAPLLCGDSHALWLVRPSADGNSFDVLFRPTGEKWQTLASGLGGKVGQIASLGGTLHVIFKDPLGHGMFQMNSPEMAPLAMPSHPHWPHGAPPLALCAADRFGAATQPSLIALVSRNPEDGDLLFPASASSTPTTGAAVAPLVYLQPFQFADGKWQALAAKAGDSLSFVHLAQNDRVMIAVAGGKLYRMISTPGREANAFAVWDNTDKDLPAWRSIPVENDLADSRPIAMLTLAGKLAVVDAGPGDKEKIHLTLFLMEDAEHFSKNAIQLNQKPYAWDASSPPMAAAVGEQFEIVWQPDGKLMDSRCALNGQLKEPEEIPTSPLEPDAQARQAFNYFLGAVFLLVVVLLALRRDMLPKPFELSPQMIPGNLLKRGFAAMLDMIPWFGIAGLVFGLTPEEVKAPLFGDPPAVTNNVIFADILGLSLYVIYGIVMETFLGATVGKLIFRLRVVGNQGQRPTLRSVALRNLMKVMELLPIPLPLVSPLPLLLFFPIFSPFRLRIGDIMARTSVVETRLLPPPVSMEPPQD